MPKCEHCKGFGRTQIYRHGRVIQVYCDCSAGDSLVKQIYKDTENRLKRLSDYPTLREYYGLDDKKG